MIVVARCRNTRDRAGIARKNFGEGNDNVEDWVDAGKVN